MSNYTWIKLYLEILDDPKVARLNDHLWRRFFELCVIAGATPTRDGVLPPVFDMAWKLRTDEDALTTDLEQLSRAGLVEYIQQIPPLEGQWIVKNFAKRQSAISDLSRKQAERKRLSRTVTAGVTNRDLEEEEDIEEDIDKDKDRETEVEVKSLFPTSAASTNFSVEIFKVYEKEIGMITPFIRDELIDCQNTYGAEWIKEAISEAAKNNARSWKYCLAILERWKRDGFRVDTRKNNSGHETKTLEEKNYEIAKQVMAMRKR